VQAIQKIETLLPFALLGIDTDNGSEFINAHLIHYCHEHHIQFTRSRPYRKNDNCFIEQKITQSYGVMSAICAMRAKTPCQRVLALDQLIAKVKIGVEQGKAQKP